MLEVSHLSLAVDAKPIVHSLSLTIVPGSVHALMGPNGSGKSSFAQAVMGHPAYTATSGSIMWQSSDITQLAPHERAQRGIFLAMQYPPAVPGVRVKQFLREACRAVQKEQFCVESFEARFAASCALLGVKPEFLNRGMNEGFSGGEKKLFELLHLLMLRPQLIMLDEIDSGLDIDALKLVGHVIEQVRTENPTSSLLIITHYQRILAYIQPDYVHVMHKGSLVDTGGYSLVQQLEAQGYDGYQ